MYIAKPEYKLNYLLAQIVGLFVIATVLSELLGIERPQVYQWVFLCWLVVLMFQACCSTLVWILYEKKALSELLLSTFRENRFPRRRHNLMTAECYLGWVREDESLPLATRLEAEKLKWQLDYLEANFRWRSYRFLEVLRSSVEIYVPEASVVDFDDWADGE